MLFTGAFVSFSEDLFLFETADFIVFAIVFNLLLLIMCQIGKLT
jgi:hypothetical protein